MENSSSDDLDREEFLLNLLFEKSASFPAKLATASQVFHVEHLKSQYEHLQILHQYHVNQLNTTKDQQRFKSYRDIANSLSSVISQYEILIANLLSK